MAQISSPASHHHLFRLLLLAVLLACALLALLARPVHSAPNLKVEVAGLSGATEENVEAVLDPARSARKGTFSETEVRRMYEQGPQLIRTALQPFGYYRANVTGQLTQTAKGWLAHYDVESGPPLRLDSVVVRVAGDGATEPEIARALGAFPLHNGDIVDQRAYERGKQQLIQAAAHTGFIDARFDENAIRIDLAKYSSAIVLHYDTGPRYRFGEVHYDQTILNPNFLKGYASFHPGDPFDLQKLLQMQIALEESPYFSEVEVHPLRDQTTANHEVPIDVSLTPARRQHYTAGLGYGTDNGAHVSGGLEVRRVNRRGHRLETNLETSRPETNGSIDYHVPFPYPATDVITLGLAAGQERYFGQLGRRASVGLTWSRMLGQWRRGLGLRWQQERFVVASDSGTIRTLEPEMTWSWVRADDRVFTRRGHNVLFTLRGAEKGVLSDVSYTQAEMNTKWIRTLTPRNRVIARLDLGAIPSSDFHRLPRSRRYFAGGAQTVRGFNYESLGPRDAAGNLIGGQYLEVVSLELDHWLGNFGVAGFSDTGNALARVSGRLAEGAGIGLRYRSFIGVLRADMGFPVSPHGRKPVFHIIMGPEL